MAGARPTARRRIGGGQTGGVVSVLVQCPVAPRPWALPVWIAWSHDPKGEPAPGTGHPTPSPLARLRRARVIRWCPARQCIVGGSRRWHQRDRPMRQPVRASAHLGPHG
jgi:hypothetical protein